MRSATPILEQGLDHFSGGQRMAVVGAFKLAGYDGPLNSADAISDEERAFSHEPTNVWQLHDVPVTVRILQHLLGRGPASSDAPSTGQRPARLD